MSVETVASRLPSESSAWTPARIFLAVSATYHLFLGIAGFVVNQTFPLSTSAAASSGDRLLGGLLTNGWHSLLGFLLGLVSLYFAMKPKYAREAAIGIGVSQVGTVLALALRDPSAYLLASNGADQVVHTFTAVVGIAAGLLTRNEQRRGAPA
ncbi:MAG: DUF4383 domain-containing protein [Actinomycetota bacterium]